MLVAVQVDQTHWIGQRAAAQDAEEGGDADSPGKPKFRSGRAPGQEIAERPLDAAILGAWLSVLRAMPAETSTLPKRRYASAGGVYPVRLYLLAKDGAVAGLDGGAYVYDPAGHTLNPVGDLAFDPHLFDGVNRGIAEGAELRTGGGELPAGVNPGGYYVAPTVFGNVAPTATIAQEEIFGPVLSIIAYEDEEDAIHIANGTPYGLAGGVWAGSDERAERVARRLRTGQVEINGGFFNISAPFGGFRQSGNGRELGRYGIEEFLEYKAMQFPVR